MNDIVDDKRKEAESLIDKNINCFIKILHFKSSVSNFVLHSYPSASIAEPCDIFPFSWQSLCELDLKWNFWVWIIEHNSGIVRDRVSNVFPSPRRVAAAVAAPPAARRAAPVAPPTPAPPGGGRCGWGASRPSRRDVAPAGCRRGWRTTEARPSPARPVDGCDVNTSTRQRVNN